MFSKILVLFLSFGVINCFSKPEGRIVGGIEAKKGEFPYMVSLRQTYGVHSCGGSILNEEYILTAAHCVDSPNSLSIQYGINVIASNGPNVIKVKRVVVHKEYSSEKDLNDIALVQLQSKIQFSDTVKPIKLPIQNQEYAHGTHAILSGWGLERSGGSTQKNLQKVNLITFSDAECTKLHKGKPGPTHICGGVPEGGKGQCSGDSGGPLAINGVQVGVVSWSVKPCAIFPYPGVYTKVSHYVDWINANMVMDKSIEL